MKAKKLIATGIATSMLLLALTGCVGDCIML